MSKKTSAAKPAEEARSAILPPPSSELPTVEEGVDMFVRIKKHKLDRGDHWEAFQPEIVKIKDGVIVERRLISKPDMFEMAFSIAAECVDPRNNDKPLPAPV